MTLFRRRLIAAAAESDPFYGNVSLLLHMNGTNGSTVFTDKSINNFTVTANGNAQISTAQSKFGGASGLFDGTGDSLSIASSTAFDLSVSNWVVEGWFRFSSRSAGMRLWGLSDGSNIAALLVDSAGDTSKLDLNHVGITSLSKSATGVLSDNTWIHIAVESVSGTATIYVNGTASGGTTGSWPITGASSFRIGELASPYGGTAYNGYIDEFRVTKGVSRYAGNFATQTKEFPNK